MHQDEPLIRLATPSAEPTPSGDAGFLEGSGDATPAQATFDEGGTLPIPRRAPNAFGPPGSAEAEVRPVVPAAVRAAETAAYIQEQRLQQQRRPEPQRSQDKPRGMQVMDLQHAPTARSEEQQKMMKKRMGDGFTRMGNFNTKKPRL